MSGRSDAYGHLWETLIESCDAEVSSQTPQFTGPGTRLQYVQTYVCVQRSRCCSAISKWSPSVEQPATPSQAHPSLSLLTQATGKWDTVNNPESAQRSLMRPNYEFSSMSAGQWHVTRWPQNNGRWGGQAWSLTWRLWFIPLQSQEKR